MEQVLANLLVWLTAIWWPFVRCMAMLSMAPVLGEMMVPVTVRLWCRWCWRLSCCR